MAAKSLAQPAPQSQPAGWCSADTFVRADARLNPLVTAK